MNKNDLAEIEDNQLRWALNVARCPFCGLLPIVEMFQTLTYVECVYCNFRVHGKGPYSDRSDKDRPDYGNVQDVLNKWNTRNGVLVKMEEYTFYSMIKNTLYYKIDKLARNEI